MIKENDMEKNMPFVTAIIVVYNEEQYIGQAVRSFLEQDYPADRMELLIIDGGSTDHTVEAARKSVQQHTLSHEQCMPVRYLENPKRVLAAGWNIGIREAKGDYVVRIDAHAQADPQLIRKCILILLENPDIACAGGHIEAKPLTEKGRLIADVLSSPFGVGNSRFRYAEKSGYVDTVAYGVYRKAIFDKAGFFNEEFVRNQDNDMHGRIKECGGRFYLDTSVHSIYHSRETVKALMKQGFGNGKWTVLVWKMSESKQGLSLRHMVPLAFVLANTVLAVLGMFHKTFRRFFAGMYAVYFGAAVFFAAQKTDKFSSICKMCGCYWLLHMSYGLGSLTEVLHK